MAILKADILSEVNKRCERAETDIDSILKAVLRDLTITFPFLHVEAETSTQAGKANYNLEDFPENIRKVDIVKIDDGEPLDEIRTFTDYQTLIAEETSADYDEPTSFIVYRDVLYLWPTPDDVYTLTVFASVLEDDVDDIDLPDRFEEAIIEGCCFKLYESLGEGNTEAAKVHLGLYTDAVNKLRSLEIEKSNAKSVVYNDI